MQWRLVTDITAKVLEALYMELHRFFSQNPLRTPPYSSILACQGLQRPKPGSGPLKPWQTLVKKPRPCSNPEA